MKQKSFAKNSRNHDNKMKGDTMEKTETKLRAVGYCRTSSEGQRDNTSIPRQKESIEKFVAYNKWEFLHHYVDESISGGKVEGRENFQQMLRDAADGTFGFVVCYDITRFARDGSDIIGNATFLKRNFGVHTIDTTGSFDTRDRRKVLTNYVFAGMSEEEKLKIMERTIGGRKQKAKEGKLWCAHPPFGREWIKTGKETGYWRISEAGLRLRKALQRYIKGEQLAPLAEEYGFANAQTIQQAVRSSQLSGVYQATFNAPEIGIINEKIPVPAVPNVISAELEKRVKDRLEHNTHWNKQFVKRDYLLSGFVKCSHCGQALKAGTTRKTKKGKLVEEIGYYRHYHSDNEKACPYKAIRGDLLENGVLDYLYSFFLDRPAFEKAVANALPDKADRRALVVAVRRVDGKIAGISKRISNLVESAAKGFDAPELTDKLNELKAKRATLQTRKDELTATLEDLPDPAVVKRDAEQLRALFIKQHTRKDWHKLSYEDIRAFLHFLFTENPRKNGYGISVGWSNGKWKVEFEGCVSFYHELVDGRPVSEAYSKEADRIIGNVEKEYKQAVDQTPDSSNLLRQGGVSKTIALKATVTIAA